MNPSIKNL